MMEKIFGSLSINIAPFSSLKLEILPLRRAVKKVSGINVKVCLDVENLRKQRSLDKQKYVTLFYILTVFHRHLNAKCRRNMVDEMTFSLN